MNQAHVACAKHPSPGSQPKKTAPQYVELSFRTRHPRLFCNEHFTSSSSKESLGTCLRQQHVQHSFEVPSMQQCSCMLAPACRRKLTCSSSCIACSGVQGVQDCAFLVGHAHVRMQCCAACAELCRTHAGQRFRSGDFPKVMTTFRLDFEGL